jgi:hypothetical protein
MAHISILSFAPDKLPPDEMVAALRIETAIVNHCIANRHGFMDAALSDKLRRVEATARERIEVLQDMMNDPR